MKAIKIGYGRYYIFINFIMVPSNRKLSVKADRMSGWTLKYNKISS